MGWFTFTKKPSRAFEPFNEGVRLSLQAAETAKAGNQAAADALHRQALLAFDKALALDPSHAAAAGGAPKEKHFHRRAMVAHSLAVTADDALAPAKEALSRARAHLGEPE